MIYSLNKDTAPKCKNVRKSEMQKIRILIKYVLVIYSFSKMLFVITDIYAAHVRCVDRTSYNIFRCSKWVLAFISFHWLSFTTDISMSRLRGFVYQLSPNAEAFNQSAKKRQQWETQTLVEVKSIMRTRSHCRKVTSVVQRLQWTFIVLSCLLLTTTVVLRDRDKDRDTGLFMSKLHFVFITTSRITFQPSSFSDVPSETV